MQAKALRLKFHSILTVITMTTLMTTPIPSSHSAATLTSQFRSENELRIIAQEFGSVPTEGGTFQKIHAGSINDSGDVAFIADLSGPELLSAILLSNNNGIQVILRSGEDSPVGGKYKGFNDLDMTLLQPKGKDENLLMFHAELDGGPSPEGIFLWRTDGVQALALAGQKSPRGNVYKSFSNLTIASVNPIDSTFKMAFIAFMQDNKKSVIIQPSYADAVEILTSKDQIGPLQEVVDDFTISQMGFSLGCVVEAHLPRKKKKHFRKLVILHDGFIVSGDALKEGVKFPGLGKVDQILQPPAINFQSAFASIVFKNSDSALAIRDVDGASEVFAKTGDTVPDLASEIIQTFGPPVSSSAPGGPFGVVSVVRLSDGRGALWMAGFTHKIPLEADSKKLLLIGGNGFSEGQSIILSSFFPIKLTNKGSLLLRGTIVEGETSREGLFLLDGLFNDLPPL
jgi:hypothetical protein